MLQGMNIHQIAFAARTDEDERLIKQRLQLVGANWAEDEVYAIGEVAGQPGSNRAKLLFNYDLGCEVEILRYLDGPNYLDAAGIPSGQLCHIGMHFEGEGQAGEFDFPVVQRVVTQSHTNPFVNDAKRHYRYSIYDTRSTMGVFMKVIERLNRDEEN